MAMVRQPAEIFGYSWKSKTDEAMQYRTNYICPFTKEKCNKQSRLVDYPGGVCSVEYDNDVLALCPNRFLHNNVVFRDIALNYFKSTDNLVVFHEVKLKNFGSFDYVMAKHEPMSCTIVDFVIIEVQGYQTTATGGLIEGLKDAMNGTIDAKKSYRFGLNHYDIVKRTLIQMLHKGKVMEVWKQKIFWVIQDSLFHEFTRRYNLGDLKYSLADYTNFVIYDLNPDQENYILQLKEFNSIGIDALFDAFRNNFDVPDKKAFIKKLHDKLELKMQIKMNIVNKK
jgi:hypothetical protein